MIAGATGDPPSGALFVFEGEPDPGDEARAFMDADPYVAAGLVAESRIEPWTVVAERPFAGPRPDRGRRGAPPADRLRLRKVPVPGPMRTSTTPVRGILEAMGSATAEAPATAIAALEELAARFEPGDIDVPGGSARIRLEVTDGRDQDAIIELPSIHLGPPAGSPDARLSADTRTWESIAADVAGGMQAFRRGQLRVRENLHLGVGFLAATTGSTEPGRLRFGRIANGQPRHRLLRGGGGAAVDLPARPRRHQGLVPAHDRRSGAGRQPGHRDRPARLR